MSAAARSPAPTQLSRALAALACVACATLALAQSAQAASADVVISEIYVGGGFPDSAYDASYVELFNRGSSAVALDGWTLQNRAANGAWLTAPLSGSIQPGRFYLIEIGAPNLGTNVLPASDAQAGLFAATADAGAIALVTDQTALNCGNAPNDCAPVATVRDLVGWGATTAAEGSPATGNADRLRSLTRIARPSVSPLPRASACRDGDDNASDFGSLLASPANSAAAPVTCPPPDAAPTVVETIPANGAVNVPRDQKLTIRFSETVRFSRVSLTCEGLGTTEFTPAPASGTTFVLGHRVLRYGSSCTLTIPTAGVTDQDADDPPDTLPADVSITFTVEPVPADLVLATLTTTRAVADATGRLALRAKCSADGFGNCTTTVTLTMPPPRSPAARTRRPIQIGKGTFLIGHGTTGTLLLKLNKAGRAALAATGELKATATLTSTDGAGTVREATSVLTIKRQRTKPAGR